jgi:DNA-binding NtrC family response regulator
MERTLLIVDDEPELCELMGDLAQSIATKILFAYNGEEALQIVRSRTGSESVDAILSDINMPKKSGVELLAEIRQLGLQTPFVFLTGYGDREKMTAAIRLGAFDFFDKPAKNKDVIARLSQALDYGVLVRTLDVEIEQLMKTAADPNLRDAISNVLIMRKQRQAYFRKAG